MVPERLLVPDSGMTCRRTLDNRTCHTAVLDVIIWAVGQQRSVNLFNCALEMLYLLAYLLTYL